MAAFAAIAAARGGRRRLPRPAEHQRRLAGGVGGHLRNLVRAPARSQGVQTADTRQLSVSRLGEPSTYKYI